MSTLIAACIASFVIAQLLILKYEKFTVTKLYTKVHGLWCIAAAVWSCWLYHGSFKESAAIITLLLAFISAETLVYAVFCIIFIIIFL